MDRLILSSLLLIVAVSLQAQQFDPERVTAWENAGSTDPIVPSEDEVDITDHGADPTGAVSANTAYSNAIAELEGAAGTIFFPEGTYLFTSGIHVPDSVFLIGESSATELRFDLSGSGNMIHMTGTLAGTQYPLAETAVKGTAEVELEDGSTFLPGDVIRLYEFDEDLMFSSWAYGTLGQVVEITEVNGNTLTLADPLNHDYTLSREAYIRKMNPRRAAGLSCLKLIREDATTGQTSNIYMNNAYNCVIRNVESVDCNFGHVEVNSSAHITVEGSFFHHAHAYGGGGQGYGVVFQLASSFCLAQDNIFEHLRHSMLLQSGANGNVYGYNYSYDPFWVSGFLPSNSAGDAVLHGNYVFLNLFEGNTIQNIVVDASHGSNGPFNTFFRNRAELYGFFSDSGTPTDSMNVVGNEITNSGFPLGMFSVNGNGHYSYGNNVNGTATPNGTSAMTENTLYLEETDLPAMLDGLAMPAIGYPNQINTQTLDAEQRFSDEEFVECTEQLITGVRATGSDVSALFAEKALILPKEWIPATVHIYSTDGRQLLAKTMTSTRMDLSEFPSHAVLLIRISDQHSSPYQTLKVITQ